MGKFNKLEGEYRKHVRARARTKTREYNIIIYEALILLRDNPNISSYRFSGIVNLSYSKAAKIRAELTKLGLFNNGITEKGSRFIELVSELSLIVNGYKPSLGLVIRQ